MEDYSISDGVGVLRMKIKVREAIIVR